jgi:hypothetical protein
LNKASPSGLGHVRYGLHRHKLAIALANKLARIAWSILRHEGFRYPSRYRGDLALSTEFAIEKVHGTDR